VADNQGLLQVSAEQRDELEDWAQSRSLPAGALFRARLILALADGMSYREIERKFGASAPTVSKWKSRFEEQGIEGLQGRQQGSKPRRATPAVQALVIRRAQQKPADGSTHWSCRKLSEDLGISKSTVQRILAQAKLQPHRLDRYMASNDPEFESKAADIIGLYKNPPQHAAVFCVDEKTAIQALDRLDPVLPLSPGRDERHGFEYYRHGTLSLYAALNVKTGMVEGKAVHRHTSAEFVGFLENLVTKAKWGAGEFTSCSTIFRHTKHRPSQQFLADHPKVRLHFTPTYSSWLNQVEIWFAKIERDVIARGVFTSVADLRRKLMKFIRAYATRARPIRWTYTDPKRRITVKRIAGTGHLAHCPIFGFRKLLRGLVCLRHRDYFCTDVDESFSTFCDRALDPVVRGCSHRVSPTGDGQGNRAAQF
jgi:transposase